MSSGIEPALRSPAGYDLGRKAMEAMEQHRVWPTPTNYELWIRYVGEKTSALVVEMNGLIEAGEPFTDAVSERLAAKYLPKGQFNGEILEAGEALSKELDSVSRAIESARETSQTYGAQLAAAGESFDGDDTQAIKEVVETLSAATRKVQAENKALETQLHDTTAELGKLREHLEQVRRDALTDALSGLANRKAFDEALERACQEADAGGEPLTLAVIDIDFFKHFNDTWGHQTGDQVIRYVGSVISRASPAPRLGVRYGGEEFAIIFRGESIRPAMLSMESIREEVSSRILKRRSTNEDLGAITVSAGIAERKMGETPAALLERADQALYASKKAGRNRTTCATENSTATRAA
jgi:diguanylate cyclase